MRPGLKSAKLLAPSKAIVKAIAMGADACMIGRPFLYGLGTAGEEGIDWVLDFLKQGMHQTMALLGARSLADLSPGLIETRSKNFSDND